MTASPLVSCATLRLWLWELEPDRLDEAHRVLDLLSDRWDEALERLRDTVESEPVSR